MELTNKRPIWVWIIFVVFVLSGLSGTYRYYSIAIGSTVMPEGLDRPESLVYYVYVFGTTFAYVIAATLLFFRNEYSKWLFAVLLAASVTSNLYKQLFGTVPEEFNLQLLVTGLTSLMMYGLIIFYISRLKTRGYFASPST